MYPSEKVILCSPLAEDSAGKDMESGKNMGILLLLQIAFFLKVSENIIKPVKPTSSKQW